MDAPDSISGPVEAADLRFRNLAAARSAYGAEVEENVRSQLSREAHGLLSSTEPRSPNGQSTWSPWAAASEAGHNEELAHRGATLILRGAVDGVVASLVLISLGDAAGWGGQRTVAIDVVLLCCLAVYSACREALENVTYKAYYQRERQRESWGTQRMPRPSAGAHARRGGWGVEVSLVGWIYSDRGVGGPGRGWVGQGVPAPSCRHASGVSIPLTYPLQSSTTFQRVRSRRWCSSTTARGCRSVRHASS